MGDEVNAEISDFEKTLPEDVTIFKITDQSKVVGDSVSNFLQELLIAICAVVIVVMLLLPLRVALVAASTIPISIFVSLALLYAFDIELNTVTLAALIVTLGMIVDNSIVIIDSYLEMISEGMSRWHASIRSATHFFKSIMSATLAISVTFFPLLFTMTGMTADCLKSFPWAITLILMISLLVAELLVPFMQFYFIRKPGKRNKPNGGRKKASLLDGLQKWYDRLIDWCFKYPKTVLGIGVASVIAGAVLLSRVPQQLMPTAERNQFAVEIYLPTGTAVEKTANVADSLEHLLRQDPRVVSVASFKGCGSPRFQTSYAPQAGGPNYAQFIVNTTGNKDTEALLDEYTPKYREAFPEAVVRFKQLSYSEALSPVEICMSGDDLNTLQSEADRIAKIMRAMPSLTLVRTDFNEPLAATRITLDETKTSRIGITNMALETTLAMRYGGGMAIGTVWEGDYDIPIVMKSARSDRADYGDVRDELKPVAGGLANVPLRQVADIEPSWENGQIVRRNGIRTITVMAETERGENAIKAIAEVRAAIEESPLAEGVSVTYGGEQENGDEMMPKLMSGLLIAVGLIFFILVFHFKRVRTATLLLVSLSLCLLGTAIGIMAQGVDFSVTCVLGIVSLMGILVRNGIIMIDYAEELRKEERLHTREAILLSAKRRMRPIFLTSAAASMGVIPMILGGSSLWKPMGAVIFYGTLITMVFILTVIPVAYWMVLKGSTERRIALEKMEKE